MRNLSASTVFEATGTWIWVVQLAVSLTFAALHGSFYIKLRRPLMGWLTAFFLSRALMALALAVFWSEPAETYALVVLLGTLIGGTLLAGVPLTAGVVRSLGTAPSVTPRTLLVWTMAGAAYVSTTGVVGLAMGSFDDVYLVFIVRPVFIFASVASLVAVFRDHGVAAAQRPVLRLLRAGFLALLGFMLVETVFRARIALGAGDAGVLMATVVTNLSGIFILGVASLLAVIAGERVHAQDLIAREVQLGRQDAEAERLESLGRMAFGIARDFNQVLSIVQQDISDLRTTDVSATSGASRHIESIREATTRGTRLTRRLLILARQQGGDHRQFRPAEVLRDLIPLLTRTVSHRHNLVTTIDSAWSVVMSSSQFEQLVLNLALNAQDVAQAGTIIHVQLEDLTLDAPLTLTHGTCQAGRWIRVTVDDAGAGILPDAVPSLFESIEAPAADAGMSLGLMAVSHATRSVGGHLHVTSTPHVGTRVEAWLPVDSTPLNAVAERLKFQTPMSAPVIWGVDV